jgi:octaprenyl-diphosphate synthase
MHAETMATIRHPVADALERVEQMIADHLHSDVPLIEQVGQHIIEGGGKRIRPMLVLLAGGGLAEIQEKLIKQAVVVEYIHTATLLHDDVVDDSSLRRGRLTSNSLWGNSAAVLVGDFLYTRAFELMVELDSPKVMRVMARATNTISQGEVLQLMNLGKIDLTCSEVLNIARSKTAELFAASCCTGGLLSGAQEGLGQQLYQFGLELGMAYQIVDDALDYVSSAELTGKNPGDDLAEGKVTLPLILALEQVSKTEADWIRESILKRDRSAFTDVLGIIEASGVLNQCRQMATERIQKALGCLETYPQGAHRRALETLAHFVSQRQA